MPKYTYTARDALGDQVEGMLEAADEKSVAQRLAQSGYYATSITPHSTGARGSYVSRLRGVNRRQLTMFTRQLATMVRAGLPLLSGLDVLIQQTDDPALAKILREVRLDLNEGSSFTQALARHPRVFSKLYVSNVKVGEETGNLEEVLDRMANFIEWEDSLRSAIISSLMYPAIVLCIAFGVSIFLLTGVLPEFKKVYERAKVDLPGITKFMFALSTLVTDYWYILIAAAVGLVALYILLKRTLPGRLAMDRFKLRLPIVSQFIKKVAAVRFARSLEIMARSGVAVVSALEIIRETMTNEVYTRAIADISHEVQGGRTIGSALRDHPEFEPMLTQMVAVGEETGQLDNMLGFVGDSYEQQIDHLSKALPKLIEPILLVFLAFVVAIIALSLFLPIFNMISVVENIG